MREHFLKVIESAEKVKKAALMNKPKQAEKLGDETLKLFKVMILKIEEIEEKQRGE